MKIRYTITSLSVILVLILSSPFIIAYGDPFEITGADSSLDAGLTNSSNLADLLDQVLPRYIVREAGSLRYHALQVVPTALQQALEQAAVRVVIHYASSNRYVALQYPGELVSDTTPPIINSEIEVLPVPGDHMQVTWTTDEFADSEIRYGTQPGVYSETLAETAHVKDHALILEGLTEGTTYYFRVRSTDLSGNTTESGEHNFVAAPYQAGSTYLPVILR
ncbi:MAG: fibronectin type III domain-containing protein [Anaerolineae bacterium]|nr:fibronectin type III domain-containing protein [Anaerolineae bacterium]